ncbi:MAG: peptidase M61 [Rhodoferax sp.]|uniref:M61 family metallopeptidase n=1 Tax=Rhodoferax sp. TaxID=50421 RepID=UPI002724D7B5|nr:peptidase M61 [Rhodoferax sp.]MDO8450139.1 peptidase M61 [Rhodoferax sp.]
MATAAVSYQVRVQDLHAHLFQVTLTIAQPSTLQRVSLPAWIPGSYLVREFSRNLQRLQARQGTRVIAATQIDKCSWQVPCSADKPLVLSYEIYAFDNSVRTAWLDSARGFFNGTSLFLQVEGQEASVHELALVADKALPRWQVATGLTPRKTTRDGFGTYLAASYDELVDSPVEMGEFWSGSFVAAGIPHRFVVAGAPPSFDGARLLANTQAICEAEIRFWHGAKAGSRSGHRPPHKNYLFMLNAVDDGYGGLEHRNSTALICTRKDLPRLSNPALTPGSAKPTGTKPKQSDGYTTLLGLISHEYFHTWNVKRLRPAEFARYDYGGENYTQLLWFFEGFTSYYDDLLLRRGGLIDDTTYLKLLTKTINQVLQTPGRAVQTVAQASFDAWVKYYRPDENTPNATVSYYTKGALVALCLDLTLRQEGKTTLDAVMRALWLRCQGGPMLEADLSAVLAELGKRSFAREIAHWVHGTAELPVKSLLERQGIAVLEEPAQIAQRLGVRVADSAGIHIKVVLRGGAAERAGFAAGDEWLGLEVGPAKSSTSWRLTKLDDLLLYAGSATKVGALVARDKRLLKLSLTLPKAVTTWRLVARDSKLTEQWLNSP